MCAEMDRAVPENEEGSSVKAPETKVPAVDALVRTLDHPDKRRRSGAVKALMAIGQPAVPELLAVMKQHPNQDVRWTAAWILSAIRRLDARQAVHPLAQDRADVSTHKPGSFTVLYYCDTCGHRVSRADLDQGRAHLVDNVHAVCAECAEARPARPRRNGPGLWARHSLAASRHEAARSALSYGSAVVGLVVAFASVLIFAAGRV